MEGDPEAATALATFAVGQPSVTVMGRVVMPTKGEATFYRYNLPAINGPLAQGNLQTIYPRLKVLEQIQLPAETLSSVLDSVPLEGNCLLILDVPGQEAALLDSLQPQQLKRFKTLLIRGCRDPLQESAQSFDATISKLGDLSFTITKENREIDPAWPVALFNHNQILSDLRTELEKRARLLVSKASEAYQQAERIAVLEQQLAASYGQIATLQGEVGGLGARMAAEGAQREDLQRQIVERDAQLALVSATVADLESTLAGQKTLVEVLSKGRTQQDALYQELSLKRDSLQNETESLNQRLADLEALLEGKELKAQLVDAEFQKVESQVALIKEIFLREKND